MNSSCTVSTPARSCFSPLLDGATWPPPLTSLSLPSYPSGQQITLIPSPECFVFPTTNFYSCYSAPLHATNISCLYCPTFYLASARPLCWPRGDVDPFSHLISVPTPVILFLEVILPGLSPFPPFFSPFSSLSLPSLPHSSPSPSHFP